MHRRSLLSLVGAGALAGCVGLPSGGPGGATPSATADGPGDATSPTDGPREVPIGTTVAPEHGPGPIAFTDARVQESVFRWNTFYTVHTRDDGQYVVADVSTKGDGWGGDDGAFALGAYDTALVVDDAAYRADETLSGRGRVVFPVPATAADRAAVRVRVGGETVSWVLDDATTAALARVPEFVVRDARVVVEESPTDDGASPVLALTVANEGDRDGRFRGLSCFAHLADSCEPFSVAVPAGKTATHRESLFGVDDPEQLGFTREVGPDTRSFWYG